MNLILALVTFSCFLLIFWIIRLLRTIKAQNRSSQFLISSKEPIPALLQNIHNTPVYGYDRDRRITFWNDASKKHYGFQKEEAIGQLIEDLILPEKVKDSAVKSIDSWIAGDNENPMAGLIFQTKSGHPLATHPHHIRQQDKGGHLEMYCVGTELNTQSHAKKIQPQIEEKIMPVLEEAGLAKAIFQHSNESIIVTSPDKIILSANPAFLELTGYSENDVVGKESSSFRSDKHDLAFFSEITNQIDIVGKWQGELWIKRKSGEDFLIWFTVKTIYNQDKSIQFLIAFFSELTERKNAETQALKHANYDPLTSLPNRNMFLDRLKQEMKKSNRSNKPLSLLFLDLDKFKEVNDTFGHPVGDTLLIEAAQRITDCLRDTDSIARFGGDEFTVILPDLDDSHSIERIASKIIDSLSQPFHLEHNIIYVSASIGITLYPDDSNDVHGLLKNADQAMYSAKDAGRSQFSYFTPEMQQSSLERFSLTNDLRQALEKDQLELYYQPIVYLPTGQIHKAEALIRWKHPEKGMISPAEFIPLAEDSGLIIEIGAWVFQQATKQARIFQEQYADFQISINVSPAQFREQNDWSSAITEVYFSGSNVVIEITEGLLMENNAQAVKQLLNFRDAGIQVAIDDFGTGYSSLSYLNKFDIDYLKIDQSFIRNLSPDSNEMALSDAIIVMAHKLGLKVIAEGVETEEQRYLLAAAGCDYLQGFLFSKPLPVDEFAALLDSNRSK